MTPTTSMTTDQLASELRLAVTRLARRLRQQADTGITPSQLAALSTVERLGPIALSELAAAEQVQPPTVTRIAAGLEEAGLVERLGDPSDRRVTRLAITREGRRLLERVRSRKNAYLARRLAGMNAGDRAALAAAVPVLEALVEEERP